MTHTPIAIVGMACRFPGARTPDELWSLLSDGRNASGEIPPERWAVDRFHDPDPAAPDCMVTRHAGFVEGIDSFDAAFFGISPREATYLDPQQRLFLEVAWEAFEDAGLPAERFSGEAVGCFVGAASNEHAMCLLEDTRELEYFVPGSAYSVIANRTSYFFNFVGPSLAVDTACSSGLAAIHLACQSLRSGESTLALAGATHVLVSPWGSVAVSKMGLLSPDGRCKSFDASADGLGRGEGAGAFLLKPLDRALADGDRIRAVIRGTALNQNGRNNGLYSPSPVAQEAVVRAACRAAGVAPRDIEYVEAHGTGTPIGDAIEIRALAAALGEDRTAQERCLIGSVKTNIGHLDAASGIAGLMKTVLALEHRVIPAHLNFDKAPASIDFAASPFDVPRAATAWKAGGRGIAGVHAFGLGGANAHVIVARHEAGTVAPQPPTLPVHLLGISAKDEAALRELSVRYAERFDALQGDPAAVADICYSAGVGRARLTHRMAIVADSAAAFASTLRAFAAGNAPAEAIRAQCRTGRSPRVAFRLRPSGVHGAGEALVDLWRTWGISGTLFDPDSGKAPPRADVWLDIDPTMSPEQLLKLAAELFTRGAPVDWRGIYQGVARSRVPLPFYPFQRKRYTLLGRAPTAASVIGSLNLPPNPPQSTSEARELRNCPPERRAAVAGRYVETTTRRVLRVTDGELDMDLPLLAMGFDSIMATELTNALKRDMDFEVPVVAFLEGVSLRGVAELLCMHLQTAGAASELEEGVV
jgi:acyl transferase domain-containing protein